MAHGVITDQMKEAVEAYLVNGYVKKEAMLTAGYAMSTASTRQHVVFDNPVVVAYMAKRQQKLAVKHDITQDYIINKFVNIIESGEKLAQFKKIMPDGSLTWDFTGASLSELAQVRELGVEFAKSGRGKAAIDVTKFKIKEPDIHAALMALSRHLGLFNDSIEVKGSLAERIQAGRDRAYQIRNKDNGETADDDVDTVH